jgi:hypothetical protein
MPLSQKIPPLADEGVMAETMVRSESKDSLAVNLLLGWLDE